MLSRDSTWLARIAAGLASLGVLGGSVLTIAYLLHALGVVTTVPGWIPPFGAGIGLGPGNVAEKMCLLAPKTVSHACVWIDDTPVDAVYPL